MKRFLRLFTVLALAIGFVAVADRAGAVVTKATVVPSPNLSTTLSGLNSVSCVSLTVCVAVGAYVNSLDVDRTQAMIWDGTAWTITPTPNVGGGDNSLASVSCTSATFCMAVGFASDAGSSESLAMTWDGSSWTTVTSPNSSPEDNVYESVSCVAANFCMAVGYYLDGTDNFYKTLAATWDGTTLSPLASPNAGNSSYLESVSCISTTLCMAVGEQYETFTFQTLSMSWDGSTWTILTTPDPGASENLVYGVSCVSATWCVAVGGSIDSSDGDFAALIMAWNGASWTSATSPTFATENQLLGVDCLSTSDCIAVGQFRDETGIFQTMVLTWDGNTWTLLNSPNSGTGENFLSSISCPAVDTCFAAGGYQSADTEATLILALTHPVPEVTPAFTG
ncbi:MAG: hypothetical protein WEA11_06525 [Acidimicrobiales bacterium]